MAGWGSNWGSNWGGESEGFDRKRESALQSEAITLDGRIAAAGTLGGGVVSQGTLGPRIDTARWSATITYRSGATQRLRPADIIGGEFTREHTALSSWSLDIAAGIDRTEWPFAEVDILFDGNVVMRGILEKPGYELNSVATTLEGRGIGVTLLRGDVTLTVEGPIWRIIRDVWDNHTDFEATVIPGDRSDPIRYDTPTEVSGSPMQILDELHSDANMYFSILHSQPGRVVESYPAGERVREPDWDVLDGSFGPSVKDYANVVHVYGARKLDGSGERYFARARAEDEIETIGELPPHTIRDPEIDSDENAREKARAELQKLTDKDSFEGSAKIMPAPAAPGYEYPVAAFADRTTGRAYGSGAYGSGSYGRGRLRDRPETTTLEKASVSFGGRDETMDLSFTEPRGAVARIATLQQETETLKKTQ